MNNITPQGYKYGIEPNTVHPFWKEGTDVTGLTFYEFVTPSIIDNTLTHYNNVSLVADTESVNINVPLMDVVINTELLVPFIYQNNVSYLVCEGTATHELKLTGLLSQFDLSAMRINAIIPTEAPIKGENGKDGTDGITPTITATATVTDTTGTPDVTVEKTGSDTQPFFNFAFTGIKGSAGNDGKTPDLTIIATVDETTGVPDVTVTKSGTADNPIFDFAFSGLKGETGTGSGKQIIPILDTLENGGLKAGDIIVFTDSEFDITVANDIICTNSYFGGNNVSTSTYNTRTMKAFNCCMGVILQDITGYKAEIPLSLVIGEGTAFKFSRDMYMEYNATTKNISISSQVQNKGNIASVTDFSVSDPYFRVLTVGGFPLIFNNATEQPEFLQSVKVIR